MRSLNIFFVLELFYTQSSWWLFQTQRRPCEVTHDDVIKWKHFPRYWPLVRGIHRSPVNSPHKGQWRAAMMFSLICVWINGCVNNREAGDLRRHRGNYDVNVMSHCNGLVPKVRKRNTVVPSCLYKFSIRDIYTVDIILIARECQTRDIY